MVATSTKTKIPASSSIQVGSIRAYYEPGYYEPGDYEHDGTSTTARARPPSSVCPLVLHFISNS